MFLLSQKIHPYFFWTSLTLLIFQNLLNISEHFFENLDKSLYKREWHLIMTEENHKIPCLFTSSTSLIHILLDTLHILSQILKIKKWLTQSLVSPSAWNLAEKKWDRNNRNARETDCHGRQSRVMDIGGGGDSFNTRRIRREFRWNFKWTNPPVSNCL